MTGIASIDGTPYVFMGAPALPDSPPFPTMRQARSDLSATQSVFTLQQGGIELSVAFLSPVEPGDLRRQSVPLSYVGVTARSLDGQAHHVALYFDISGEWAHGNTGTQISWVDRSSPLPAAH